MASTIRHFFFLLLAGLLAMSSVPSTYAWDEAELEIFDLVEEVGQNFYEYMEIPPDASATDVRKAYRRLSLVLHPDKNDAEDAEVKFRWLASIYEILKDKEKRAIYDRVLVEGLPDWRMPVFYYRRMRKMGLAEGLAYLAAIVTVCQYFVNWAAYWEKRFTLREALAAQTKKMQKRRAKKGQTTEEIAAIDKAMEDAELNILGAKPTCFDTLPFQLFRGTKYLVLAIPTLPSVVAKAYKDSQEKKLEAARLLKEEEEARQRREDAKKEKKEQRAKRKQVERYKDRTGEATDERSSSERDVPPEVDAFSQPANALQMWTDQDLAKLAKLIKKYPAGTPERWEKIADALERLPWEVTKMASKVKEAAYQVSIPKSSQGVTGLEATKLVSDDRMEPREVSESEQQEDSDDEDSDDDGYGVYSMATKEEYVPVEIKTKKKTKGGKLGQENIDQPKISDSNDTENEDPWTQQQQKALELALTQFPKGTAERWDRIASKVPGKSKELCMLRFKNLAEAIKKKKQGCNEEAVS